MPEQELGELRLDSVGGITFTVPNKGIFYHRVPDSWHRLVVVLYIKSNDGGILSFYAENPETKERIKVFQCSEHESEQKEE